MRRTIKSGNVTEKVQFFVGNRKPRKDRVKGSSTLKQKLKNVNNAVRRLARIFNCNIQPGWVLLTLTYDEKHLPSSPAEAARQVGNFIRRAKRQGFGLQGVWITADKDKDGTIKRLHHHVVCSGEGLRMEYKGGKLSKIYAGKKELKDIWRNGFVELEPITHDDDYTNLAAYLVKQAVNDADAKKWHASLGLKQPEIVKEEILDHISELRAPGGADVREVSHFDAEMGTQYIRYVAKKRQRPPAVKLNMSDGPGAVEADALDVLIGLTREEHMEAHGGFYE